MVGWLSVALLACEDFVPKSALSGTAALARESAPNVSMAAPEAASPSAMVKQGTSEKSRSPNVILYIVDTLRADYLGTYGNDSIQTPHFDRFAESGIVFTNAYANSSWTRPSVASLLTGLYPTHHAANTRGASLPQDAETLGEILQEAGWETGLSLIHI